MRTVLAAVLIAASGALHAQADVGLVNLVSGDVTYVPAAGGVRAVQVFMKVRDGDRINVPAGGQIRVVFFDSGRQERWTGPSVFRAGRSTSSAQFGSPAEVTNLPAGSPQRLARIPDLVQNAKLGGIQVRGMTQAQKASLEQRTAVAEARATYEKMRREASTDDITPELFLYAALYEYLLYEEMKAVVDEMLRRQPANEDVKSLANWVRSRAAK